MKSLLIFTLFYGYIGTAQAEKSTKKYTAISFTGIVKKYDKKTVTLSKEGVKADFPKEAFGSQKLIVNEMATANMKVQVQ